MSEFGVFGTVHVVARGIIIKFIYCMPCVTAIVAERMDDSSSLDFGNKKQLDLFNHLASNVESAFLTSSSLNINCQMPMVVVRRKQQFMSSFNRDIQDIEKRKIHI